MISRLHSAAVLGIRGYEVQVEVDVQKVEETGRFSVVGLPDTAVRESVQRVTAALQNSHFFCPGQLLVTVNLAPADVKKQGPGFDLPIALGLEMAIQHNYSGLPEAFVRRVPADVSEWCIIGELALDGAVRGVRGVLPQAVAAREAGRRFLMVAAENAAEASVVEGMQVYAVESLSEAWQVLLDREQHAPVLPDPAAAASAAEVDFDEIKGQPYARRAMEIAAAGGHNLLMSGTPGSGKSMLASRLPTILPPMTHEEALEASQIHSVCGLLPMGGGLLSRRPFRAPHHTISDVGLMGGGSTISPGEITLAHHGVLFLDEFPEYSRRTLETLRQPLESGVVTISRASGSMDFPCQFMLVAAMNPCPCGYMGDPRHSCRCRPADVERYRRKISGPMLDRFDMVIEVPAVDPASLLSKPDGESSAAIRARVTAARRLQQARYAEVGITCNARLTGKWLRRFCPLSEAQQALLLAAVEQFGLSARAFDRILRVTRTIADLAGRETIADHDLLEAIQLRQYESQLRQ
ncbi:MAG: YifB family Mg chelatase-like AAA ATPase [Akkermansiaceae bacterium]|nr:YifB family Mg chelatase-like AAA ATPase [Akkermansiaceae bacterium]